METHENVKVSRIKSLSVLKWGCLGLVLLAVAAIGGLGFLVIPDLFYAAPTPEAVVRVGRQEAEQGRMTSGQAGLQADDEKPTATRPEGDNELSRKIGPLIEDDPMLPKAVAENRDELNREFAAVLRELDRLNAQAAGLSFEETVRRLMEILHMYADKVRRTLYDTWQAGDASRRISLESSYQPIQKKIWQFMEARVRIRLENLVRHGRWRECAVEYEYDQWENWPQAVYYWRRVGGWEGYKHIIGGAIYVRTRNYRILEPLRKLMPYKPQPQVTMVVGR